MLFAILKASFCLFSEVGREWSDANWAAANRERSFQFLIVSVPSDGICVWRAYTKGRDGAEVVKFSSLPLEFTAQAPTLAKCTHPTTQHTFCSINTGRTKLTHVRFCEQFQTVKQKAIISLKITIASWKSFSIKKAVGFFLIAYQEVVVSSKISLPTILASKHLCNVHVRFVKTVAYPHIYFLQISIWISIFALSWWQLRFLYSYRCCQLGELFTG